MEIERKFTIKKLPEDLDSYAYADIEQGYLCRNPVVRVRRFNDDYILTYKNKQERKGSDPLINIEEEFPLTKEGYEHLLEKADGNVITKRRYMIPLENGLKIELDIFHGKFEGLYFAEVEFRSVEEANSFVAPDWFDEDVTDDYHYSNGYMSSIN